MGSNITGRWRKSSCAVCEAFFALCLGVFL